MEISAVSAFTSLTPNSKIIASSSDAPAVGAVQRVIRRANEVDDTSFITNPLSGSKTQPQDRITLLGENSVTSGKAYGLDANELRNQGLKNQLSEGEVTVEKSSVAENNPVVEENDATAENNPAAAEKAESANGEELTEAEQEEVQELKDRDTEVRVHEQAHIAASGGLSQGGASFTYQQGPDGQRYAVGGEVSIDTSPGRTPEETVTKMQQVMRAALAPAEPSSTDRSVAASASQQMAQARQEMNIEEVSDEEKEEDHVKATTTDDKIDNEDNKTVEKAAVQGEDAEVVAESGLLEMPAPEANKNSGENGNSNQNAPSAKISMQRLAARAAYGISA